MKIPMLFLHPSQRFDFGGDLPFGAGGLNLGVIPTGCADL
jgi:hypothetical protein